MPKGHTAWRERSGKRASKNIYSLRADGRLPVWDVPPQWRGTGTPTRSVRDKFVMTEGIVGMCEDVSQRPPWNKEAVQHRLIPDQDNPTRAVPLGEAG